MSHAKVIKNSASQTALYATGVVLSLVMTPIYLKFLGAAGYGIWELMLALIGYLGILDLGIAPALVQFFAVAKSKESRADEARIFRTGFYALSLVGVAGGLALCVVAMYPERILGAPGAIAEATKYALFFFAANFTLSWVKTPLLCFLMGHQRHYLINFTRVVTGVLEASTIWYLLPRHPEQGLAVMAGVGFTATLVQAVVYVSNVRSQIDSSYFAWPPDKATLRGMATFGVKSASLIGSQALVKGGLLFVIAQTISVERIVFFVIPQKLTEYAVSITSAMGLPLEAHFASASGGSSTSLRQSWQVSTRILQAVGFCVALGVLWLGLDFISTWMGPAISSGSRIAFYILCFGLVCQSLAANALRLLVGTNNHGHMALLSVIVSVATIVIAALFTGSFGILWPAACLAVCNGALSAISFGKACRQLDLDIGEVFWSELKRLLPAIAAGSVAYYLARLAIPPNSFVTLAINGAVGSLAYLAAAIYFVLLPEERQFAMERLRLR
jgi:O-antigen/teichoic acid export membrane protein